MPYIDLHTHSHASDGTDSPAQLILKAKEIGLCAVAVTDHDTIAGLSEAYEQSVESNIELIRGCEVSALYGEVDMHILALWLPPSSCMLEEQLAQLRMFREERNINMVEKLCKLGLHIDYEEVIANSMGESVGRPHLAQIMLDKGYVKSRKECYLKYLGVNGKVYEPKVALNAKTIIALLISMGATVSLAHPCIMGVPYSKIESLVRKFKEYGLLAIEAYHSEQTPKDQNFCIELAKKYDLTLTGGSDYHGLAKNNIKIGRAHGNIPISAKLLDALKEQRVKLGLDI